MIAKEALLKALDAPEVMTCLKDDKFEISVSDFVRRFKEIWVYVNRVIHPINYDEFSGSLFILFYKNLGVTNLSIHEMISLLKINTSSRLEGAPNRVTFFSDNEYTQYLLHMVSSVVQSFASLHNAIPITKKEYFIDKIISLSEDVLSNTIVVSLYYSSALVHVPRSLCTNVRAIVAEAGYIHSAGSAIYVRNVEKALMGELGARLKSFLKGFSEKRVFITPYADEFFSPYDEKSPVSIRNGLSGVKLQLRKHFIQGRPLLDYLAALPAEHNVQVPLGLQHFRTEREESLEPNNNDGPTETKATVWFVVDYKVEGPERQIRPNKSDKDLYLFVYAQSFLNDNQLILFKERKPGWYASITLPHTVSISLINIVRAYKDERRSENQRTVFLDPFFGTGTTLFDAALRIEDAVILGFDRDPVASQVTLDNLRFFSSSKDYLEKIRDSSTMGEKFLKEHQKFREMRKRVSTLDLDRLTNDNLPGVEYWCFAVRTIIDNVIGEDEETSIKETLGKYSDLGMPESLKKIVTDETLSHRAKLFIYLIWRAIISERFSIRDSKDNLNDVMKKEIDKFQAELDHLIRNMEQNKIEELESFLEIESLYSHAFMINYRQMDKISNSTRRISLSKMLEMLNEIGDPVKWTPGIWLVEVNDSIEALDYLKDKVSHVVTDPPYGFNSIEEDGERQMAFFAELIPRMVGTLRTGGQLCIALPAYAKNGRQIPFFETHGAIVRQVIAAANKVGRSVVTQAETYPAPKNLFRKPFYWASASVLERRIVHFTLN